MSVRHDYKSKETWRDPRMQTRLQVRRRGLLVIGLVLTGLGGSIFGYVKTNKQEIAVATQAGPSELANTLLPEPPGALPSLPKPKYDFYTVLPERKLVIPSSELQQHRRVSPQDPEPINPQVVTMTPKPSVETTEPAPKQASRRYLIQAGSFRNYSEADRAKAAIAMLGIRARIEKGTDANGNTWNRVRLGPYENPAQLQAMRQRLKENGIDAIAVKAD